MKCIYEHGENKRTVETVSSGSSSYASDPFTWYEQSISFSADISANSFHDHHCIHLDEQVICYVNGYFTWNHKVKVIDGSCSHRQVRDVLTEVYAHIIEGRYEQLCKLSGSYLLLFVDLRTKLLYAITDRLSSRPLFWYRDDALTIISENIRDILESPAYHQKLDLRSLVEFLRFTMIFEDRTLYENIRFVPPASILIVNSQGGESKTYWEMTYDESWDKPDEYYVEKIAWAYQNALQSMFNDSDGVGLMMSGGLDSRMIASSLTSLDTTIKAISFGGFENDEVKLAKKVADRAGFPFSFIQRQTDHYFLMPEQSSQISNGLYNFYHAHMLATQDHIHSLGIHTLIHGWGLDVPFSASYIPKLKVEHIRGRYFQLIWPQRLNSADEVADRLVKNLAPPLTLELKGLAAGEIRDLWETWPREVVGRIVKKAGQHAKDFYNQYDYFLVHNFTKFRSFLFPLSVRHNFRERCPMYDAGIIEVFLELPPRLRFCSRAYGRAIRQLNPDLARLPYNRIGVSILSPEVIQTLSYFWLPTHQKLKHWWRLHRKQFLEHAAETHDSYPKVDVLFRQREGQQLANQLLEDNYLYESGLVNKSVVRRMLSAHSQGEENYSEQISALISLSLWFGRSENL